MSAKATTTRGKSSIKPKPKGLAEATPAERKRAIIRAAWISIALIYLFVLGLITWQNADGPEREWWSALNLFLPQFFWAAPAVVLIPVFAFVTRKWMWLPIAAFVWVVWPMMGFYWNSPEPAPSSARLRLRVMTYNIDGHPDSPAVAEEIERAHPDIVFLQEAIYVPALFKKGWHVAGPFGGIVAASHAPLTGVEDRQLLQAPDWRRYLRCKTEVHGVVITLYGLHLDTPRDSLQTLREKKLSGVGEFQEEAMIRFFRAEGVADSLRAERGPVILAGDMNASQPSLICKTLERAGLRDAFAEAGRGYGYTYGHALRLGMGTSYVRIDHIMIDKAWDVASCEVGGAEASDHRPVISDIYLAR